MRTTLLLAGLLAALGITGCGATRFPLPMTAAEAVVYGSGGALVAYLSQPDASSAICDIGGTTPHVRGLSPDMSAALMNGLRDGKVPPALWRRCVNVFVKRLPREQSAALFDAMARLYRTMLTDAHFENRPHLVERLSTLQRLYLDRQPGLEPHAAVVDPSFAELREALVAKKLGPLAAHFGQELLDTIDLERGAWQGHPVDVPTMDALAAAGNELTLARFARRLPSEALRTEARTRVVRIHVALSPFPEVRSAGPALEATMLRLGHNPVSLAEHPVARVWFDEAKTIKRVVAVRQNVWGRSATLLGRSPDRSGVSVLPELPLRGTLLAEVKGISRPIGVCAKSSDLDPSPCIELVEISLGTPLADISKSGAVHLKENLPMSAVLPLASQETFSIPVRIAGATGSTLEWGLYFEKPEDLIFRGGSPAGRGPALTVSVSLPLPDRARFDATVGGATWTAVVEKSDLARYRASSQGGAGSGGADGSPGSDGASGGECSNGSDGGPGGDGGDGGPGGDGGDVTASLTCGGAASCREMAGLLRPVIRSEGGPGGPGGAGGRGGSGGAGGPGRAATSHTDSDGNTVVDDPGCSAGSSGSSGSNGSDGSSGPDGKPGHVSFEVI